MKEINFSNINQFEYAQIRDSIQEAFDDIKETYSLDIMISIYEDIKSYIEEENQIQL